MRYPDRHTPILSKGSLNLLALLKSQRVMGAAYRSQSEPRKCRIRGVVHPIDMILEETSPGMAPKSNRALQITLVADAVLLAGYALGALRPDERLWPIGDSRWRWWVDW